MQEPPVLRSSTSNLDDRCDSGGWHGRSGPNLSFGTSHGWWVVLAWRLGAGSGHLRRRPMQAWVTCSGASCDPHALGGDQCCAVRGPGRPGDECSRSVKPWFRSGSGISNVTSLQCGLTTQNITTPPLRNLTSTQRDNLTTTHLDDFTISLSQNNATSTCQRHNLRTRQPHSTP